MSGDTIDAMTEGDSVTAGDPAAEGMTQWVSRLFDDPSMLRMGHDQRAEDLNLGIGWLYYAMARSHRPRHVVVIGSYRGFVPLVLAKAMRDNVEGGTLTFIDPSMVDGFWADEDAVQAHFASYDVADVRHHQMTTQAFVKTEAYRSLDPIGLLFVDGYHSYDQAKFDHEAFQPLLEPSAVVFFHDSIMVGTSRIYGADREYELSVPDYLDELRRDSQHVVFDVPIGAGVAMVRRVEDPNRGPRVVRTPGERSGKNPGATSDTGSEA